jgi:hypothetical protein
MKRGYWIRTVLGLCSLGVWGGNAEADIFVYQLPGGARIVTDHALNNRDYRLVRQSRDSRGAGTLVSGRKIQYAATDPNGYDRLIRRAALQHQVDPALVKAVMHVESAFNPHAVSDKGAQGLMQVMPETGERYGADDLFDPSQNVRAAVMYLRDLQKLFNNNMKLVLAAYNAGESAVLRYKGVPPYDETRDYVRKVMQKHRDYRAEQQLAVRVATAKRAPAGPVGATVVPVAAVQSAQPLASEKNL